jgi:hypothetical protein
LHKTKERNSRLVPILLQDQGLLVGTVNNLLRLQLPVASKDITGVSIIVRAM